MKKLTKTLTRVCVILLSLVLITSSVVSTTLAKYTVTKEGKTTAGLKKFGLAVEIDPNEDLIGNGNVDTATKSGNSFTVSYNNLLLMPGDNFTDVLKLTVKGVPVVDAKILIEVDVTYGGGKFKITNQDFGWLGATAEATYVPIVFTVGDDDATTAYTALSENDAETNIKSKITGFTTDGNGVSKALDADDYSQTKPVKEEISFGFKWPKDYASDGQAATKLKNNQIGTWLSNQEGNKASTVSVSYTITVEQTGN